MRMSVFFAMAAALMMSFLCATPGNARVVLPNPSVTKPVPRAEGCYAALGERASAEAEIVQIENAIQALERQKQSNDTSPRPMFGEEAFLAAGGYEAESQRLAAEIAAKNTELDTKKSELAKTERCTDTCQNDVLQCNALNKRAKTACDKQNLDDPNSPYNKAGDKISKELSLDPAGFSCSTKALEQLKAAFVQVTNDAVRDCEAAQSQCEGPCMTTQIKSSNDCEQATPNVGTPVMSEAQRQLNTCRDFKHSADQLRANGDAMIADIDKRIANAKSDTGDGSGVVCKKEDPKPDTVTPTKTEEDPPSKGPSKAASTDSPSSGDNKDKKDATKKNDSGMGNLASMLGPLMGAMMGNQTPTTPTATTPATTSTEDCSLAQNANNVTCICASNPRSAGCQLALNGQGTNPVTFGATGGTGGANLTKDVTNTANSADFASQQMQMPPIQPDRGGGGGGSGYVGGGGSSIGGGGLGGGGNGGGDEPRGGNRAVSSAQILSGTTGGSGFGGNRGSGMAFVDRDSDSPRGFRPRSYGKDEVLSETKPDMRAFVPIDQRLIHQTRADRQIAGAEDATYLHPAHTNIFNVMHNRYEELINPLDENGN